MENKEELLFDTVILGAGPAGFSAAIYASRGNLKTALLDINMFGGQPSNYLEIENYPGFSTIKGFELMEKFEEHADNFGVQKFPMVEIQNIDLTKNPKIIETQDIIFKAKSVIISSGAQAKKLGIPGEAEFKGRGVSYCAICDGAFYKDKTVAVIGGGNSALEEAVYLTKFAKKVFIVHRRDELRADKIVQERALNNSKIEFILSSVPIEIRGSNTVEKLVINNINTKEITELDVDGVFPYIGFSPNTNCFNGQIKQTSDGFIETDINMQTSQEGVYAAGDIRNTPLRQVITAAADGAIAACSAVKYIQKNPLSVV
ncbi:MAG: thioredoxin-disulfide reductase [Candidatus Gastranaerophilales bacterium]|nr:thioredoxin-disulfide reductase [Candidatus Gastranaerophilales bacterium]